MFENHTAVVAKKREGARSGLRSPPHGRLLGMENDDPLKPSRAAELIESRRLALGASVRKAAAAAELSEGRWRQIAKGYQIAAQGVRVPVNAPPDTLARMAAAVRVRPDEMEKVGHPQVAQLMRFMADGPPRVGAPAGEVPSGSSPAGAAAHLSDEELIAELARRLESRRVHGLGEVGGGDVDRDSPPIATEVIDAEVPGSDAGSAASRGPGRDVQG